MTDPLIVSCRLCLQPDELPTMVTIVRELANPPRTVTPSICKACARAIAVQLELMDVDGTVNAPAAPAAGAELEIDPGVAAAAAAMDADAAAPGAPKEEPESAVTRQHTRHHGRRTAAELKESE